MDYDRLLSLATDLGYGLLESGAEIYRVEESIQRLLHAYGVVQADPFVIPNCIIVSMVTPEGEPMTRVRRMPSHGTDVDLLERYNDLCRALCREPAPLAEAEERLRWIGRHRREYAMPVLMAAYVVASAAFTLFFGGTLRDALCGGLCGLAIGVALTAMTWLKTNLFFKSMIGAAISALLALGLTHVGLGQHSEKIIIGALMALVPGIIFTNAIRDVMAGDMVAGISKIADALLTGVSVALGTAFALGITRFLWGV
ncbi:threonine/serine exporter family protein [Candidatus Pseudoscillospira sp. SGI.172]|uniref:threonine/serine exporter family protein n=1 Tax=Candidatus Pseudoscillospira sp. SGI.172 TaxID=3420582 RepID=UPI0009BB4BF7|nr:threonine/serine exporter family protein [Pseudoflavonifractor sp.]MDY3020098.1 threonine/serine exporter family protein [Oscillospiraceae bacterium]